MARSANAIPPPQGSPSVARHRPRGYVRAVSYHISSEAHARILIAVTAATAALGLLPQLRTEFLDGPDGSSLHITMVVKGNVDRSVRATLVRAATNAALSALPDLSTVPLVTVMQS